MMNINEILTHLRRLTRTIMHEGYDKNPEVSSLFRSIQEACGDKNCFSEEDMRAIAIFSLELLDIPADLKGVCLAEPCTRHVLDCMFDEVPSYSELTEGQKKEIIGIKNRFMAVIDAWYGVLRASNSENLHAWPNISESLPLSFHLTAFKESKIPYSRSKKGRAKKKDEFEPHLYTALGYFFHKKLRERMIQYTNPKTKLIMEELARAPFQYANDEARKKPDYAPGYYDKKMTESWLENYRKANRSRIGGDNEQTVKDKRRSFELFLSDKQGKSRDYYVRRLMSGGDQPDYDDQPDDVILQRKKKSVGEFGLKDDEEKSKSYEPPLEIFLGMSKEDEEKKSAKWRRELLHSRFVPFGWELQSLQPHHLAFLYEALDQGIWKSRENNAIILFYRILMHTGIAPDKLIDLVEYGPWSTAESLDLKKIGERYYILNPAIVQLEGAPSPHCHKVAEKVHIPLPAEIARYVPKKPVDNIHIFSYKEGEEIVRLTQGQAAKFWLIPQAATATTRRKKKLYRNGIMLKPKNIENAFYSLYCKLCGLDPIIACHVSGMDHRLIYGPQLHYIHIPHKRLEEEYLAAFKTADNLIRELRMQYKKVGIIPPKTTTISAKEDGPITIGTDFLGYGSSAVPYDSYLKVRMTALGDAVSREKDLFRRHNLYVTYTYLALQFASMLRPHNDPKIYWHHFNRRTGTITIADKDSRKHREERILPLPDPVKTLLARLQDGRRKFEQARRQQCLSRQSPLAEKIFFKVLGNGALAPFTFETILESFKSLNLDFDVPDNMCRHYTRTRMHQTGVSNSMAAVWAGHTRTGREAAGISSTTTLAEVARACLPCINALLSELGIKELEYLP